MNDVLLSIKPKYAAMIYAGGAKTTEYRRGLPDSALYWSRIYIYECWPIRKDTGWVNITSVVVAPVDTVWRMFRNEGGISQAEYSEYMNGKKNESKSN